MDVFPTQYSVLSAKALGKFLAVKYPLQGMTCRLLIHNVSDTYILESSKVKFIFKIYRDSHRKLKEIEAEVELLSLLKDGKAKVSFPILDLEGKYIQSFNAAEGTRYGVLFNYAIGKVVPDMNDEQLITVGREMAKIHNITSTIELKNYRKEYSIDTTLINPLIIFKPAFEELREEYAFLNETVNRVANSVNKLNLENFSYGYCQYDFLPKNFHFDNTGNITFFDFDFAGKGYLINDVASFYIHFFLEVYYGKLYQDDADKAFAIFVAAYRQVRPISDEELAAIPYFGFAFWIFYLGFQYENFDDWSNIFFGPKFLKDRTTLIKKWVEWYLD
ncbi:MAG: hypothetical protein EOP00_11460 [Pedobacter sp.]|nr:MAG: hypothetical protein EOP00_11460 [Pedobacter sp.]